MDEEYDELRIEFGGQKVRGDVSIAKTMISTCNARGDVSGFT